VSNELKRIVLWVDSKNEELEQVLNTFKKSLDSIKVGYNIVDVIDLTKVEDS
jgi:exonuclease VII small subunit